MNPTKDPEQDKFNPARNPGDEAYEREMQQHYDKPLDPSKSILDNPTTRDDDPGEDALRAQDQEENPEDIASRTDDDIGTQEARGDVNFKSNVTARSEGAKASPLARLRSRRNAVVLAVTLVGASGGFIALITAPAFAIVQLKEAMVGKFGDRMQSLQQVRVNRIVAKQLAGNPLTTGCKVKVKCRYKGMSQRQIDKFQRRNPGVQIRTEGRAVSGRHKIKSIGFTDENGRFRFVTAKDFHRAARNSIAFKKLIINYNKSKVALWRDKTAGKVFLKLKLFTGKHRSTRGPPQTEEEIRNQQETKKKERLERRLALSEKYKGTIRKADIISTLCAIKGLVAVGKNAVKVALAAKLAAFAINYMNAADDIKSGNATGDSGTINNISNLGSSLTQQDENGKTAFDSFGYQYASSGVMIKEKGNQEDYQMGVNSEKGFLGKVLSASKDTPGLSQLSTVVNAALNPTVCLVSGGVSLAACFLTGGVGCITSTVVIGALVNVALPLILKNLIKTPDVEGSVGGDAGDATTGGVSYLSKTNNQYRGGYPLSKSQAVKYDRFSDNAQGGGNWEETASMFDVYDPSSFAGKLASAFLPGLVKASASPLNIPSTLANMPTTAMAHSLTSTTQARSVIPGEYKQCEDGDYESLDVAADPFCVPQYGFDPSMMLGDEDFNKATASLDEAPRSEGFSLASFFALPTAQAASVGETRGFEPDDRFDADSVITYMCGHPLNDETSCDKWVDDNGAALTHPDKDDDFADYTEKCLETTEPLSKDSPDMCKTKDCKAAGQSSDTFRYCMYSQFAADSGIDDQLEDRDASSANGSGTNGVEDTPENSDESGVSGDAKTLAQDLLDNPNVTYPYTDTKGVKVDEVLKEVAKTGKGIVNSPDVSFTRIEVSADMLKALVEYAKNNKIGLNALTNADHSSTSNHYKGIAIDIACAPSLKREEFEAIASKYGGKNNGETCPGAAHWHYDFPKQDGN